MKSIKVWRLRRQGRHRGFTLIEVLVAIVILSFGLLGMVGLQAASLKANREAKLQATGVRFASELGDMMRGNKAVSIQTTSANNPYLGDFAVAPATPSPNCFSVACTTAMQSAQADIADWLARVTNELPGARAVICFDATPFTAAGVPQWACSNSGGVVNVKIGWTKGTTNRAATGAAAFDAATVPSVILPIVAGN